MSKGRVYSFMIVIAVASAAAGLLFSALTDAPSRLAGAIYGACIGLSISTFERGLILRQFSATARRWPTPLYIPVMEAMTVLLALFGFLVAGSLCWLIGLVPVSFREAVLPTPVALVYALFIAAVLVTLSRMRDLLGHEVFVSLLLGRYHKPVEERRIFLFLDVVGSTDFARRHGDLRAQAYLGAIFAAIAEPVMAHKGAIDDYVGDMVMITWPEASGLARARCVACVFAILKTFEHGRDSWLRGFGQVPRFHAALHGGSVVTAEIGIDRHKISYFGDVVNTTSRIEALCRHLAAPVLISSDLLSRLPNLPAGVGAFSRGEHPIKGHAHRLSVFSLEAAQGLDLQSSAALTTCEEEPQFQRLGAHSAP